VSSELPLLLLAGFRVLVDALHERLAEQGHPGVRPVHGFALQAVGPEGCTAVELGRRLGVSKQAAAKHVAALEGLGYLRREDDPADARRRTLRLTERGRDCLARSAAEFAALRAGWAAEIGEERLRALEDDLRAVTHGAPLRVDAPGWLAGG
jgi:DNA-binding MarR family transcriptional regulator